MPRLQSGQRWWAAEIALRSAGLALLCLCAVVAWQLYRLAHLPPQHLQKPEEVLAATISILSWSIGGALLVEGAGLFKRVPLPPRHRRFPS